jgi:GT2 family glycosyltransferase
MDESYPFYGEDMDLAYRVHRAGLEVCQVPAARVIHLGSGSTQGTLTSTMQVRSYYEAPLRFLRSHGTPIDVLLWRIGRGSAASVRYGFVRLFLRGADAEQQLEFWSGVFQLCVSGSPQTWSLRTTG